MRLNQIRASPSKGPGRTFEANMSSRSVCVGGAEGSRLSRRAAVSSPIWYVYCGIRDRERTRALPPRVSRRRPVPGLAVSARSTYGSSIPAGVGVKGCGQGELGARYVTIQTNAHNYGMTGSHAGLLFFGGGGG